jgi:hypothetical protein
MVGSFTICVPLRLQATHAGVSQSEGKLRSEGQSDPARRDNLKVTCGHPRRLWGRNGGSIKRIAGMSQYLLLNFQSFLLEYGFII